MTTLRKDIAENDQWDVQSMYSSLASWQKEITAVTKKKDALFAQFASFKGSFIRSQKNVLACLDLLFSTERHLRKLYTYAHLRHDEDTKDSAYKEAYQTITGIYHQFSQEVSWVDAEIVSLPHKKLTQYLKAASLKKYHFFLEKLVRLQAHTLDAEKERLLALADQALHTSESTFSAINNSDFQFGTVYDSSGKEHPLTHGSYSLYLRSEDRTLRKNSFLQLSGKYHEYQNTLAELIRGKVEQHGFYKAARKYSSCLEAALFPRNIDTSVYHSLIKAVRKNISALHEYIALRKKVLKLKTMHMYDLYVPLLTGVDRKYSYDEAVTLVTESVKVLGSEYHDTLKKGLTHHRWVDRYENSYKRSGAYSSGCYDSIPYILMNFKGTLRDVFTLAHEAGHSMHSNYSRTHQPYHYSDYAIFVAEVASTFNEELLMHHMLQHVTNEKERAFLINEQLEDIRATFFRQTMFAEFELFLHELQEQRIPITPQLLREKYRELNTFYFGDSVVIDDEITIEWARIPHFYYNFYVFQYATGISAAIHLSDHVLRGGTKQRDSYLAFLQAGSSDYPVQLLQKAGVDVTKPKTFETTIARFRELTKQLSLTLAS